MKKIISLLLGVTLLATTVACSHSQNANKQTSIVDSINNHSTQSMDIPSGSTVDGILQQNLSSGKNHNDEQFQLKVKNSLFGKNPLKDAVIHGHVEDVVKAARGKKASLHLIFDDIQLQDGKAYPLNATLVNTQVETKTKGKFIQNTSIILGGAVAGHFLGKATKFKHGALSGGAAATAFVLSSPGGEVVLNKGTDIKLKLQNGLDTNSLAR